MSKKVLWLGIASILLSWVLNYAYYQSNQLDSPIFLDHYYEVNTAYDEQPLTFYYLTNKENPAEVQYVTIDGIDFEVYPVGNHSFWEGSEPSYEQSFRHQYLKSVTLEFNENILALKEQGNSFSFERMEVFFNDQSSIVADIGKVNFYRTEDSDVFDSRMSSSSNQHWSHEAMLTREPITIEQISVPFDLNKEVAIKVETNQQRLEELENLSHKGEIPEWIEEEQELKWEEKSGALSTEDIFPFKLGKGEWVSLNMYFNPNRTSYYQFGIKMEGKTEKGETFINYSPINDQPYLNQQQVDKIIAEKVGEEE
ncbi:hypothetical protein M3181_16790 [Mesobacillus maritimus]|uniref:hypothetical protein n=1 Tax=Mesobacillus maritimus TaxID=1643336 RepID=UPI00203DBC4D|nr:hypothetical protein [Mesobacillus maritimus]MCM3670622.1 hypothetical protein [Mesobacillus maritimus]